MFFFQARYYPRQKSERTSLSLDPPDQQQIPTNSNYNLPDSGTNEINGNNINTINPRENYGDNAGRGGSFVRAEISKLNNLVKNNNSTNKISRKTVPETDQKNQENPINIEEPLELSNCENSNCNFAVEVGGGGGEIQPKVVQTVLQERKACMKVFGKITLETGGEDVKVHSKRVVKM